MLLLTYRQTFLLFCLLMCLLFLASSLLPPYPPPPPPSKRLGSLYEKRHSAGQRHIGEKLFEDWVTWLIAHSCLHLHRCDGVAKLFVSFLMFVFFTSVSSRNEITGIFTDGKCTQSLSSASMLYVYPIHSKMNSIHINSHTWILQSWRIISSSVHLF